MSVHTTSVEGASTAETIASAISIDKHFLSWKNVVAISIDNNSLLQLILEGISGILARLKGNLVFILTMPY